MSELMALQIKFITRINQKITHTITIRVLIKTGSEYLAGRNIETVYFLLFNGI